MCFAGILHTVCKNARKRKRTTCVDGRERSALHHTGRGALTLHTLRERINVTKVKGHLQSMHNILRILREEESISLDL